MKSPTMRVLRRLKNLDSSTEPLTPPSRHRSEEPERNVVSCKRTDEVQKTKVQTKTRERNNKYEQR